MALSEPLLEEQRAQSYPLAEWRALNWVHFPMSPTPWSSRGHLSWVCLLFKWEHDVETQGIQQMQVELICWVCMCQGEGQRASLPLSLPAKAPPRPLWYLKYIMTLLNV